MAFRLRDLAMYANKNNKTSEKNSYLIVSKANDVEESDLRDLIKIIDETGKEVSCTVEKFLEIFDYQGLEGFIL
ncbi:hypothetical protein J6G99_08930 [bacterium]|nr:hypothetical protein [bacterium]